MQFKFITKKSVSILISIILVAVFLFWNSDDRKDGLVWNEFRKSINQNQVEELMINPLPGQKIPLNKTEQNQLIHLLREAKFESSNRVRHGSTPDGSLWLKYKDKTVSVSYYRGTLGVSSIFELSPRHLDPETQFYIESEALGKFIEAKLPK